MTDELALQRPDQIDPWAVTIAMKAELPPEQDLAPGDDEIYSDLGDIYYECVQIILAMNNMIEVKEGDEKASAVNRLKHALDHLCSHSAYIRLRLDALESQLEDPNDLSPRA